MDLEKYMPQSSKSEQNNQVYEDVKFDLEEYKRLRDEGKKENSKEQPIEQKVKPNIEGKGYGYMNSKYIVKNINMEEKKLKPKEEVKVEEVKSEPIMQQVVETTSTSKEKMLEERIKQLELELLKKELAEIKEAKNVKEAKIENIDVNIDFKEEVEKIEEEVELNDFDMEVFEKQMNGFTDNEVLSDYDLEKNIENEMLEELANDLEEIKEQEEVKEEEQTIKIEPKEEKIEENIEEILEKLENVTFDDEIEDNIENSEDFDFTITGNFEDEQEVIEPVVEQEENLIYNDLEKEKLSELEETLRNIENNNVYIREKNEGFDLDNYLPGTNIPINIQEDDNIIETQEIKEEEEKEEEIKITLEELAKLESMKFEYQEEEEVKKEEVSKIESSASEERKDILDRLYQTKPIEFIDNDEIIKKFEKVELKKDKEEVYTHVEDNSEDGFDLNQFLTKMSDVKECEINKYHENDIKKEVKHLTIEDFKHEIDEKVNKEDKEENLEEQKKENSFDMSKFLPDLNKDEY